MDAFNHYYSSIWGVRWEALKHSLKNQNQDHYATFEQVKGKPYYLDQASIWVAKSVPQNEGQIILDLCSAPGGKSLILASCLKEGSTLLSNEWSKNRRLRLKKILQTHLETSVVQKIAIKGVNGLGVHKSTISLYHHILVDAPCSSEQHLLCQDKLQNWSPARGKRLAKQQLGMLRSALHKLEFEGTLTYSTCSINPKENDEVIEKLLQTSMYKLKPLLLNCDFGEKTKYGFLILPDQNNFGPIYACQIQKKTIE